IREAAAAGAAAAAAAAAAPPQDLLLLLLLTTGRATEPPCLPARCRQGELEDTVMAAAGEGEGVGELLEVVEEEEVEELGELGPGGVWTGTLSHHALVSTNTITTTTNTTTTTTTTTNTTTTTSTTTTTTTTTPLVVMEGVVEVVETTGIGPLGRNTFTETEEEEEEEEEGEEERGVGDGTKRSGPPPGASIRGPGRQTARHTHQLSGRLRLKCRFNPEPWFTANANAPPRSRRELPQRALVTGGGGGAR
ncbi:hypothetical protein CRUP_016972, partial [Coryphaenoides rupestris]